MSLALGHEVEAKRLLWPFIRGRRALAAGVIVLGVLSSLTEGVGIGLFIPFLQQVTSASGGVEPQSHWISEQIGSVFHILPESRRLLAICVGIVIAITLTAGLTYAYRVLGHWLEAQTGDELRRSLFELYLDVDYSYIERARSGTLLNVLAAETWRASQAVSLLLELFVVVATILVYVGLLLLISWKLTIVVGLSLVLISCVVNAITRRAGPGSSDFARANATISNLMQETLGGMKVVRAFGREDYEQARFDRASRRVADSLFRLQYLAAAVEPMHELLAATLLVVVAFISLREPGNMPTVLVFIFVLYRMQPRMKQLDRLRSQIAASVGPVREVHATLERDTKPYLPVGDLPCRPIERDIAFEDVTFSYPQRSEPALHSVSFRLLARQTTAIVGPSGSGKTTIAKLLLRLYDPESGLIRLDDQPLSETNVSAWRQQVASVSQDPFVFNASIRDNIAYGRLNASDEEIVRAAKLAYADEFINKLPQGYDTIVGERGTQLSGGQQQRLTLARAEIREPDLLILDEATNALDSRSEEMILSALHKMRHQRTVLVIAHRLATVASADHVVVLEQGRVKEQGTPDELLRRSGLYADLHRLQHGDAAAR